MKQFIIVLLSVLMLVVVGCGTAEAGNSAPQAEKKITLDTEAAKASYAIGYNMGQYVKNMGPEMNMDILMKGLKDGAATEVKPMIPMEEMQKVMRSFQQKAMKKQQEQRKVQGEQNQKEGQAFLDANAKKEGVKVTKSGLQYKVITEGKGLKPKATDKVKVHYRGTLMNGTEFDSSYKRGEPAVFPLNRVIPGWTEGVQLMTVGSKYKFFIPGKLAYGERGRGQQILPNSLLIFDIELLEIVKEDPKKPADPKKAPKPAPVKKTEKK